MTTKYLTGLGVKGSPVYSTVDDLTLYVRSGGSDTADGLTVGTALLTIQEAIDRVPKQIQHDVVIDIGSGNFAGVMVTGFHIEYGGTLTLQGTLDTFSPATGNDSGTATGGSTTQLIDTGSGTWTTNDLRGALLYVNSEWRVIRSNTATTIDLVGPSSSTCDGKAYEIQEQVTVLNAAGTKNWLGKIDVIANVAYRDNLFVNDLKTSGGTVGVLCFSGRIPSMNRVRTTGSTYGTLVQSAAGEAKWYDMCADTTGSDGFNFTSMSCKMGVFDRSLAFSNGGRGFFFQVDMASADYIYADDSSGAYAISIGNSTAFKSPNMFINNAGSIGLYISASTWVSVENLTVDICGSDGVVVYDTNKMNFDTVSISNATGNGLEVGLGTAFVDIDSGTIEDNGGYGVKVDENASGNKQAFSFVNLSGTITIQNNTLGGVAALNNSVVALTNVDGSNTGYGLTLETSSTATITTDTGITGSSGDATINSGTTVLDWTDDFGSDGDKAINLDNQCMIERKDS